MRTNKELIQIAIDNFHLFEKYHCGGLCNYINNLYYDFKITYLEHGILISLIKNNRSFIINLKLYFRIFGGYYFKPDETKSRLKYLNYLLDKYKNENS